MLDRIRKSLLRAADQGKVLDLCFAAVERGVAERNLDLLQVAVGYVYLSLQRYGQIDPTECRCSACNRSSQEESLIALSRLAICYTCARVVVQEGRSRGLP